MTAPHGGGHPGSIPDGIGFFKTREYQH